MVGVVSKLMQLITLVVVTPLKISLTPMLLGSPKCSKTRLIVFHLKKSSTSSDERIDEALIVGESADPIGRIRPGLIP